MKPSPPLVWFLLSLWSVAGLVGWTGLAEVFSPGTFAHLVGGESFTAAVCTPLGAFVCALLIVEEKLGSRCALLGELAFRYTGLNLVELVGCATVAIGAGLGFGTGLGIGVAVPVGSGASGEPGLRGAAFGFAAGIFCATFGAALGGINAVFVVFVAFAWNVLAGDATRRLYSQFASVRTDLPSAPRVYHSPGRKLLGFARFFFSPKTADRVFEPVLVDLEVEYAAALDEDRRLARKVIRKASWVQIRGYYSFWESFCLQGPLSIVKRLFQIWKLIP